MLAFRRWIRPSPCTRRNRPKLSAALDYLQEVQNSHCLEDFTAGPFSMLLWWVLYLRLREPFMRVVYFSYHLS